MSDNPNHSLNMGDGEQPTQVNATIDGLVASHQAESHHLRQTIADLERKMHQLKIDARRWRAFAKDLALQKAAAAAAKKEGDATTVAESSSAAEADAVSMQLLAMTKEILRLKKAHAAEIKLLRQQAGQAGNGASTSFRSIDSDAATAATTQMSSASVSFRSIDSDAATAATKQMSNVTEEHDDDFDGDDDDDFDERHYTKVMEYYDRLDGHHSTLSSMLQRRQEQHQEEEEDDFNEEDNELLTKIRQLYERLDGFTSLPSNLKAQVKDMYERLDGHHSNSSMPMPAVVDTKKTKPSTSQMVASALASGAAASATVPSSIAARSRRKNHTYGRRRITSRRQPTGRARPRSESPPPHPRSRSGTPPHLHNSDSALNYHIPTASDRKTNDESPAPTTSTSMKQRNSTSQEIKASATSKLSGGKSPGDNPTVPLAYLPEKRSSIGRVA
jgi:hypothetical protein